MRTAFNRRLGFACALALAVVVAMGAARARTQPASTNIVVTVQAQANSWTGGTGAATEIEVTPGDHLFVAAGPDPAWSAGDDEPCSRSSGPDGLTGCYGPFASAGLTANYGSLVGQVGAAAPFLVGSRFEGTMDAAGPLKLWYWDSNAHDNTGAVVALVTLVDGPPPGPASSPGETDPCDTSLEDLTGLRDALQHTRSALIREVDDLADKIVEAQEWEGLPVGVDLWRFELKNGEAYYLCPYCRGEERSLLNRIHADQCVDERNVVYHAERLPRDVESFRFVFEAMRQADRNALLARYRLCGDNVVANAARTTFYTNWALRDEYVRIKSIVLEQKRAALGLADGQLAAVAERIRLAQSAQCR